jgi:predicted ester cyclase
MALTRFRRCFKREGFVMPEYQRDAWVRDYLKDVFNGHNLQSLDKYMDENIVSHWLGDRSLHGREAWKEAMGNFFGAFPDASYTLNDLFFAADKGVWRGTWHASSVRNGREFPQRAARRSGP